MKLSQIKTKQTNLVSENGSETSRQNRRRNVSCSMTCLKQRIRARFENDLTQLGRYPVNQSLHHQIHTENFLIFTLSVRIANL